MPDSNLHALELTNVFRATGVCHPDCGRVYFGQLSIDSRRSAWPSESAAVFARARVFVASFESHHCSEVGSGKLARPQHSAADGSNERFSFCSRRCCPRSQSGAVLLASCLCRDLSGSLPSHSAELLLPLAHLRTSSAVET